MAEKTQYRLVNPPPRVDGTTGWFNVSASDLPRSLELEGLSWAFDGWDGDIALYRRA